MKETYYLRFISGKHSYLLPPLISGIALIAAFPPFEQGYLAWIVLLPLLDTCLNNNPGRAFWAGVVFGLPLNLYLNLYLTQVLFNYLSIPLAVTAIVGLIIYISLFHGLFALGVSLINRLQISWFTALAVPSLWILAEYLRSLGFMAYNVGYLGYSQWAYPALLNITAVYGYWGLPFFIILFQTILVLVWRKKLSGRRLQAVSTVFFLMLISGLLLPSFEPLKGDNRHLQVALIQGNSDPEQIIENGKSEIMHRYLDLTRQAVTADEIVRLVIWPETVVDLNITFEEKHNPAMIEAAEDLGIRILYGARVRNKDKSYNSITLITDRQSDMQFYNKIRLVPFVEYFPLDDLLNRLLKLKLLLGTYTAGEEIIVFEVDGINLAGVICFESYFGDHTRLFAAEGIEHLFILTNDAWFGESIGLDQHAQAAAIRAAEMGLGVTQVANSGITISFDYQGRELFRSGKNEVAIINTSLNLTGRNTIYVRCGDYFPAVVALFIIFNVFFLLLNKKTTSRNPLR